MGFCGEQFVLRLSITIEDDFCSYYYYQVLGLMVFDQTFSPPGEGIFVMLSV